MSVDKKVLKDLMSILTQLTEASSEEGDGFQEKKGRGRPSTLMRFAYLPFCYNSYTLFILLLK